MMNKTQIEAFKTIVNYLDDSERRHFVSEGEPDDHIYRASMILKDFIDGNAGRQPASPTEKVASSPNGEHAPREQRAGAVLDGRRWEILYTLINFASLPEQLKVFVDDALKDCDPDLIQAAHDALKHYLGRQREIEDIPY